jgi:hypothetical protein
VNGKPTHHLKTIVVVHKISVKIMLAYSFFNNLGALHHEFATAGERVNSAFCVEVLKHLRDATQCTELKKWRNKWILHHESPPCHTSLVGQ